MLNKSTRRPNPDQNRKLPGTIPVYRKAVLHGPISTLGFGAMLFGIFLHNIILDGLAFFAFTLNCILIITGPIYHRNGSAWDWNWRLGPFLALIISLNALSFQCGQDCNQGPHKRTNSQASRRPATTSVPHEKDTFDEVSEANNLPDPYAALINKDNIVIRAGKWPIWIIKGYELAPWDEDGDLLNLATNTRAVLFRGVVTKAGYWPISLDVGDRVPPE